MCTTCGLRPAVYHRRYSGERLCLECLGESLRHKVRRAIARYQMLTPDSRILLVLRGDVMEDGLAAKLFMEVERDFPGVQISFLVLFGAGRPVRCPQLRVAIREAEARGVQKVVLPLAAEEIVASDILWISGRSGCLFLRGRLLYPKPPEGLDVILPLYDALGWEVAAAFRRRASDPPPALDLIRSLEEDFPGSTYNMLRSMERMADALGDIL